MADQKPDLENYFIPVTEGLTQKEQMEEMSATIERDLITMPQKLEQVVENNQEPINIQGHANKIIACIKEEVFTEKEAAIIQKKELIAPGLLPAIVEPLEVQDLRMLANYGDKKDLQEWVETACEIMPQIVPEPKFNLP